MSLLIPFLIAGCGFSEKPERLTIPIDSPTGIGTHTLTRPDGGWPEEVVVQLKVKRLEFFGLSHNQKSYSLARAMTDAPKWRQEGKGMEPVDAAVQWEQGFWFYITLPDHVMNHQPQAIQVSWIDAYRQ